MVSNSFGYQKGVMSNFYQEIRKHTHIDYIELSSFDEQLKEEKNASNTLLSIVSFSPTETSAGTQSVVTITGSNFGTIKGKFCKCFRYADINLDR